MTQDNKNTQHFVSEDGKTFVNKETGMRMGWDMYLCDTDGIDNYEEQDLTEEEIALKEELEKKAEKPKRKED